MSVLVLLHKRYSNLHPTLPSPAHEKTVTYIESTSRAKNAPEAPACPRQTLIACPAKATRLPFPPAKHVTSVLVTVGQSWALEINNNPCGGRTPGGEAVWERYLEGPSFGAAVGHGLCQEAAPAHGVLLVGALPGPQLHVQDTPLGEDRPDGTAICSQIHLGGCTHTRRQSWKGNVNSNSSHVATSPFRLVLIIQSLPH